MKGGKREMMNEWINNMWMYVLYSKFINKWMKNCVGMIKDD